jgi:hypothetical protein
VSDRDDETYDAAYYPGTGYLGLDEGIRVRLGDWDSRREEVLDIREAVYFRYLLDGAINDYERAVGK